MVNYSKGEIGVEYMLLNKIPIVSFFTGGGFLDIGFEDEGFDVVFTNEYDSSFADLYAFGMSSLRNNDHYQISSVKSLIQLSPSFIEANAFPSGKPSLWGIVGGPPCQDFTTNGKKEGFVGERGKMTMVFFNRIRKMQPSFFVMENVPGLTRSKKTSGILDEIVSRYCFDDYYLDKFILNALDYGVPQNRERMFLIGLSKTSFNNLPLKDKHGSLYSLDFTKPKPIFENAKKKYDWPRMNPFGETPSKPKNIPLKLCVNEYLITESDRSNSVTNIDDICPLTKDVDQRKLIYEGDTSRQSFKRLHRFRFSPTTCYGNNEVHLHPYENRRISIREALRIQGVPDSYALPPSISLTKKFKLVGNGVPIPLAKAVANSLFNFISLHRNK